eukprot:TRINITY_DN47762_c0_g1_i1.p1 TRINITY_DN47762_c0_g1~~TRINITY_DN47762_c0_g1_i1.p1  ORF type:complete len:258 (+),score=64.78 TRINITY_DN47762_c0_g1_i1:89-862(+)
MVVLCNLGDYRCVCKPCRPRDRDDSDSESSSGSSSGDEDEIIMWSDDMEGDVFGTRRVLTRLQLARTRSRIARQQSKAAGGSWFGWLFGGGSQAPARQATAMNLGGDDEELQDEMDFSGLAGNWALNRIEGDMEACMVDAGVPWSTRSLARKFNYGVGLVSHVIEQVDSEVSITYRGGLATYVQKMDRRGRETPGSDEQGTEILSKASTDGRALILECRAKRDGKPQQLVKRYVEGGELIQEIHHAKGIVKRIFKKK